MEAFVLLLDFILSSLQHTCMPHYIPMTVITTACPTTTYPLAKLTYFGNQFVCLSLHRGAVSSIIAPDEALIQWSGDTPAQNKCRRRRCLSRVSAHLRSDSGGGSVIDKWPIYCLNSHTAQHVYCNRFSSHLT